MLNRRQFTKYALATIPLGHALAAIDSKVDGVQLGVQSYSFRDLSFNDALQAMVTDGLGLCELFAPHIELGQLDKPPARTRGQAAALREWRLSVPMSYFEGIKKKFDAAGVDLYAYNLSFNDAFSDEEIDRGFDMARR